MAIREKIIKNKTALSLILIVFSLLFLLFSQKISNNINNSVESLFYQINGAREVDSNIVIIKITENDISALGGWPLKRSYYALLINKLNELKVSKIGLEIFLANNNSNQKIYNNLIINEVKKKGNVVFSAIVNNLEIKENKYFAESLLLPGLKHEYPELIIGHINFVESNGYIIPEKIKIGTEIINSFSQLIAGISRDNKLKINFISSFENFNSYSLLEFFSDSENNFALKNKFENKIVLVGVTDPTIGKSLSTPFNKTLPGIGLHAFAVNNIISNQGLNDSYYFSSLILFFLLLVLSLFIIRKARLCFYFGILVVLFLTSYFSFVFYFIEFHYAGFIIPLVLLILFEIYLIFAEREVELNTAFSENEILQKALSSKEEKLLFLENELNKTNKPPTELLNQIESLNVKFHKVV